MAPPSLLPPPSFAAAAPGPGGIVPADPDPPSPLSWSPTEPEDVVTSATPDPLDVIAPTAPNPLFGAAPTAPDPLFGAAPTAPDPLFDAAPTAPDPLFDAAPTAPDPLDVTAPATPDPLFGASPMDDLGPTGEPPIAYRFPSAVGTAREDQMEDRMGDRTSNWPPGTGSLPTPDQLGDSDQDPADTIARRRALLGRQSSQTGSSALLRRLGGRTGATSLGPGGTSAELVALGAGHHVEDPRAQLPVTFSSTQEDVTGAEPVAEFTTLVSPPVGTPVPSTPVPSTPVPSTPVPSTPIPNTPIPNTPVPSTSGALTVPGISVSSAVPAAAAAAAVDDDLPQLIASLARRGGDLFGVADTAQVLADDLVERAEADAAAVLVPDGPIWRVSGGVGLDLSEWRIVLDATHWLVTEIALNGQVLLLQDTGPVQPKLAGAPLASWQHLLAVPVPQVRALALLARRSAARPFGGPFSEPFSGPFGGPFGEEDLARIVAPVSEAADLLVTALRTRELARMLAPLREDDDSRQR